MFFFVVGLKNPFGKSAEKTIFFETKRSNTYPNWWFDVEVTRSRTIIGVMFDWHNEEGHKVAISIGLLGFTLHARISKIEGVK
jgi:hypothetical protein